MDANVSGEGGEVPKTNKSCNEDGGSKLKNSGSLSRKDMIFRADKIDLGNLDVQLEKHLSRVWSRNIERPSDQTPKEEWEIDPSMLEIRYLVAQGTYGTIYRGTYDSQDVAVKLFDWGEDGVSSSSETAAIRASFKQEVSVWHKLDHPNVTKFVGASMGTSQLKIPSKNPSDGYTRLPSRACCVLVEFVSGGNLKSYLSKNRKKKPLKLWSNLLWI